MRLPIYSILLALLSFSVIGCKKAKSPTSTLVVAKHVPIVGKMRTYDDNWVLRYGEAHENRVLVGIGVSLVDSSNEHVIVQSGNVTMNIKHDSSHAFRYLDEKGEHSMPILDRSMTDEQLINTVELKRKSP